MDSGKLQGNMLLNLVAVILIFIAVWNVLDFALAAVTGGTYTFTPVRGLVLPVVCALIIGGLAFGQQSMSKKE